MANAQHVKLLDKGVSYWNDWCESRPEVKADLCEADLEYFDLRGANLFGADLKGASLSGADLCGAVLTNTELIGACLEEADLHKADLNWADASTAIFRKADLTNADLRGSHFCEAKMSGAILRRARMNWADLEKANLTNTDLRGADLSMARLVRTNFKGADLSGCRVYGCSVWDIKVPGATQEDLIITPKGRPSVTVDDLKVAQFIYLMLKNPEIRNVIDTITSKAVLILGRFTKKRKEVLDAIANELRTINLVPIIFDFKKPKDQDLIETVITIAGMSKFVIADVTDARVISDELRSFVSDFATPVVLLFHPSKKEPKPYASLYTLYKKYHWVFEPIEYKNKEHLIKILHTKIIEQAEDKYLELHANK